MAQPFNFMTLPRLNLYDNAPEIAQLYNEADVDRDGVINGQDALKFFTRSGLPGVVLKEVWDKADTAKRGTLDRQQFTVAMRLIQKAMLGQPLTLDGPMMQPKPATPVAGGPMAMGPSPMQPQPQPLGGAPGSRLSMTMPSPSASASPSPYMMAGVSTPTASGPLSAAGPTMDESALAMQPQDRAKYQDVFAKVGGNATGFIDDAPARALFAKSGLNPADINKICTLADIDGDHKYDREEFFIAMHLITVKMRTPTFIIPDKLPSILVPPGKAKPAAAPSTAAFPTQDPLFDDSFGSMPSSTGGSAASTPKVPSIPSIGQFGFGATTPSGMGASSFGAGAQVRATPRMQDDPEVRQLTAILEQTKAAETEIVKQVSRQSSATESVTFKINELKESIAEKERQIAERKQQLEALRIEENALNASLEESKNALEVLTNERKALDAQISTIRARIEIGHRSLEQLRQEAAELQQENQKIHDLFKLGTSKAEALEQEVLNLQEQIQIQSAEAQQQKEQLIKMKESMIQTKNQKEQLEQQVQQYKQQLAELRAEAAEVRKKNDNLSAEMSSLGTASLEYKKATKEAEDRLKELLKERDNLKERYSSSSNELIARENLLSNGGNSNKINQMKQLLEAARSSMDQFSAILAEFGTPEQISAIASAPTQQKSSRPATPDDERAWKDSWDATVTATRRDSWDSFNDNFYSTSTATTKRPVAEDSSLETRIKSLALDSSTSPKQASPAAAQAAVAAPASTSSWGSSFDDDDSFGSGFATATATAATGSASGSPAAATASPAAPPSASSWGFDDSGWGNSWGTSTTAAAATTTTTATATTTTPAASNGFIASFDDADDFGSGFTTTTTSIKPPPPTTTTTLPPPPPAPASFDDFDSKFDAGDDDFFSGSAKSTPTAANSTSNKADDDPWASFGASSGGVVAVADDFDQFGKGDDADFDADFGDFGTSSKTTTTTTTTTTTANDEDWIF